MLSASHPSEVDQVSTRNSSELTGKKLTVKPIKRGHKVFMFSGNFSFFSYDD